MLLKGATCVNQMSIASEERTPHKVNFGNSIIEFLLKRTPRKTLGIQVKPNGAVLVNAPESASLKKINEVVARRASWILKHQENFARYPNPLPAPQYVSGESFCYLGRQYRLKVDAGKPSQAKLKGQFLRITLNNPKQRYQVRNLVDIWLRDKAQAVFVSLLEECVKNSSVIGVSSPPPLRIRKMKRRWGSCSRKGVITLNPDLLAAPKACIRYVIIHELCHLVEMNHSKRFYKLLTVLLPDWKKQKERLNQTVELRLDY
jgi:predicted metal-dependent hydrolase